MKTLILSLALLTSVEQQVAVLLRQTKFVKELSVKSGRERRNERRAKSIQSKGR